MASDMDRMRQALNSTPEQQAALRRVLDQVAPPQPVTFFPDPSTARGLVACLICGAAVVANDPAAPMDLVQIHRDWHAQLVEGRA